MLLLPVYLLFDLHMFTAVLADTQAETNSKTLYCHAKLKLIGVHTNTFSGYLSCSLFYFALDTISLSKLVHLSLQNRFVSLGGGGRYRSGCHNFPSTSYQSCLSSLAARLYEYCEELQCIMFSPLGREENTNVLKSSSLIRIYLNMYIQSTVSYSLLQCEMDFIIPPKPKNHPASAFSFFLLAWETDVHLLLYVTTTFSLLISYFISWGLFSKLYGEIMQNHA